MSKKILITDDVHPLLLQGLSQDGYVCDYRPDTTDAAVRQCIQDYEGLIVNSKINVDAAMMAAAPKLRFVARIGSGMEIVDRAYAAQHNIVVVSAPEGNRNAVAEQALGMLLSLYNNLIISDKEVRQEIWQREKNRGTELLGQTIGIIGFGHTGSSFAAKLAGLGMRIMVCDKYLPAGFSQNFPIPQSQLAHINLEPKGDLVQSNTRLWPEFDTFNYGFSTIEEASLADIQAQADIISFHLPLTPETQHLANKTFFEACAKPVVIINTSRGKVVHTADLVAALANGQIKGACLDVFENEKPATYTEAERALYAQLWQNPNVILSPHVAGWTHESKRRLAEVLWHKIRESVIKRPDTEG